MVKKILVTGGAGFVGQHTIDRLGGSGFAVSGVDKVWSDSWGIDLAEEGGAERAFDFFQPDVVIHLAATCSTPASIERPMETFRDTVMTAVSVLEACRWDQTPILITSSVKARDGKTPYGAAKRMVELWAQEYADAYDIPVIINRPGTIYGPGQEGSAESGWIAWFLRAKDEGIRVTVNGDGKQIRDLLHVYDYVDLMAYQLNDFERFTGTIWDVGGGVENAVTVEDMVEHLGLAHDHGPDRYGDAPVYIGENLVPGWQPRIGWRESGFFG
jgi:CDP-paratose 2-epimerase